VRQLTGAAAGWTARAREGPRLPCRVRLADGRVFSGELPAAKHRAIQLGMLHAASPGFVELTPGTRPPGGKVQINRRDQPEHFLPGGAAGDPRWLARLLKHAQRIVEGAYARRWFTEGAREECFVGVTSRSERSGDREHVSESRWLWVDIDEPDRLEGLYAFLAQRPCHLLVSSAVIRSRGRGDRCASGDDRWRHVADGRIGLTRVGRGRHTTCTTCRPPLGAPSCRCVRKKGWRP
jgi:hypothetical protein